MSMLTKKQLDELETVNERFPDGYVIPGDKLSEIIRGYRKYLEAVKHHDNCKSGFSKEQAELKYEGKVIQANGLQSRIDYHSSRLTALKEGV